MFYHWSMADEANPFRQKSLEGQLFELRRTHFDTPHLRGIEFIEVEAKTALNHVPGSYLPFSWTINPYRGCSHACVYCFARATHPYLDMNAGRDFETKIVVKVNVAHVLRAQLAKRSWRGEHIAMGTNTDPYQPAEGKYRLMPQILRALIDFRNPFSILTKGTMIVRDLDLLLAASRVTDVHTAMSIGTVDEAAWRATEPGTPHPRQRLEAVAAMNAAGIPCGVLMAPILPGITDDPALLRRTAAAAIEAGATHVSPILLHLRPGVKEVFMDWLQRKYPGLVQSYDATYHSRSYAAPAHRKRFEATMQAVMRSVPRPRPGSMPVRWQRQHPETAREAPAEQLALV